MIGTDAHVYLQAAVTIFHKGGAMFDKMLRVCFPETYARAQAWEEQKKAKALALQASSDLCDVLVYGMQQCVQLLNTKPVMHAVLVVYYVVCLYRRSLTTFRQR